MGFVAVVVFLLQANSPFQLRKRYKRCSDTLYVHTDPDSLPSFA